MQPITFTCIECGRTSSHPMDVLEQYCGHCHDWTVSKTRTTSARNPLLWGIPVEDVILNTEAL